MSLGSHILFCPSSVSCCPLYTSRLGGRGDLHVLFFDIGLQNSVKSTSVREANTLTRSAIVCGLRTSVTASSDSHSTKVGLSIPLSVQ